MIFDSIINYGKLKGKYSEFRLGDKNRYPHMDLKVNYDSKFDIYKSTDIEHNAKELLQKDLAIRELMIPTARTLFIKDMLGIKYNNSEKLNALDDVANWQMPKYTIETIVPQGFGWTKNIPLNLIKVETTGIFPIGVMVKGTDIAIIDQNASTRGQEIAHAIYHYNEGIEKGNENILEIHGDPFFVYALQCRDGRISRRIRQGESPHKIKFPDYICLRAWAGTKINKGEYNWALGLLAPSINLAATLVNETTLTEALFNGSSTKLENAFNQYLGEGSYDKVFGSYDVFNRLEYIKSKDPGDAKDRMFFKPLFNSEISQEDIKNIWENPSTRESKILELLKTL